MDGKTQKCALEECTVKFKPYGNGKSKKRYCCEAHKRKGSRRKNTPPTSSVKEVMAKEAKKQQEAREREQLKKELEDHQKKVQVIDALSEAIGTHEGWKPLRYIKRDGVKKYEIEHANIMLSDHHRGEEVRKEELGGLGEYNDKIAHERLQSLAQSIYDIITIHRKAYEIPTLNMWLGGDILDGERIYKGQERNIDLCSVDQFTVTFDDTVEFILNMLDVFKEINFFAVPGNHGRQGQKGEGPTWNNWDYLLYVMLERFLSNYKQIKWHIPRSWWLAADVLGWKFCMQHGEDIKMHYRIPYYGLERDSREMSDLLMSVEDIAPHYWLYAHFHKTEQADLNRGERIMNGSLVGTSLYSSKGLRMAGRPTQMFFGVSKKRGITWRYPIRLDQ